MANLALLITGIIWGSAFVFQKFAADELSTAFIIAGRFSVAGVLLLIATAKKWHVIDKVYLKGGLLAGITLATGSALQTMGLAMGTTPGKSAFLTPAYCVMMPFIYWFFVKEKPKRNHVISAVLCLIGIGFISLDGDFRMTLGDGLTLLCSFMFGLNIIVLSIFSKDRNPLVLTMIQIVIAALIGWTALILTGGMPTNLTMESAANVVYLALFPTALCLSLQTFGFKYTNPTVGTIILSLESVFGVAFSAVLYGETITRKIGVGFVIVFAAVMLSQLSFDKKAKENASKMAES